MSEARAFAPDSRCVAAVRPSPNHGDRLGPGRPDAVVLHYTGMRDGPSAVSRLCAADSDVSCHYVVDEDGTVLQLVPESRRAWHAGRSCWAGRADLNSASIGIEIVNGGHDFGLPPFPERQVEAVTALCRDIVARHAVPPDRILAHSDVAPGRKQDPGERFPWNRLAAAGVGLWVPPSTDLSPALPLEAGVLARLQADLARFGYDIAATGVADAASHRVIAAFQRRFRPARVDGMADAGTRDTLARLMVLRFGPDPAVPPGPA